MDYVLTGAGCPRGPSGGRECYESSSPCCTSSGIFTLEKFIRNGARASEGTTDPEKAEAWTLNMLKTFRATQTKLEEEP